jgi:hypothetical protein
MPKHGPPIQPGRLKTCLIRAADILAASVEKGLAAINPALAIRNALDTDIVELIVAHDIELRGRK